MLNLQKLKVLIVDDNQHMRSLVKSILRSFMVKTMRECSGGTAALEELRLFPADIVICDLAMLPLDGLKFTRILRMASDSPNPYIPIIMMTGHTEMRNVIDARNVGVSEILAKPISAEALYRRIASIIEKPRQFVRVGNYFGPDRRRNRATYSGPERRSERPGADTDLSQEEINAFMHSS